MLKFKRKLQFKGHVYFEAVRPEHIFNALQWLRKNNELYENIEINMGNIDRQLTCIGYDENAGVCGEVSTAESDLSDRDSGDLNSDDSEKEEPRNEHRGGTSETCLQALIPDYPVIIDDEEHDNLCRSLGNEIYGIAPGENKHPVCVMGDRYCEELAFPSLLPKGRYGYKAQRGIKLSPIKYFNARFLHYSGRFAMNPEYLFFGQFVIEHKKVSDSISIALKKLRGQMVTASQLRSGDQYIKQLVFKDQAYLFLRDIPGSPAYWQKFLFEVLAMVKNLGVPSWFMTLSCADLRWNDLFHILSKINGDQMTDDQIENLSYDQKCSMLNLNPVIVAKHFQHRVESFVKHVLLSSVKPIGEIIYYALRIEFQMRGSPHLHALIWTSDCPELTLDNENAYITYIDKRLPDRVKEPEYYDLVNMYQRHSHSRSCKKYRNIPCRFNFGQFFTDETVVAKPLPEDLPDEEKTLLLNRRNEILSAVKQKINEKLDPSKANYDPSLSAEDLLGSCNVSMDEYNKLALCTSSDGEVC